MHFTQAQKQILDFLPQARQFNLAFITARLIMLKLPESKRLEAAGMMLAQEAHRMRMFLNTAKKILDLFINIAKSTNPEWSTHKKIENKCEEYINIFVEALQNKPNREKGRIHSFPAPYRQLDLMPELDFVCNFLADNMVDEPFTFNKINLFLASPKDDTPEFWTAVILHHSQSILFDYSEEKALEGCLSLLKMTETRALIDKGSFVALPIDDLFGKISNAFLTRELISDEPNVKPEDLAASINQYGEKIKRSLAQYQNQLISTKPKWISTRARTILVDGFIVVGGLLFFANMLSGAQLLIALTSLWALDQYHVRSSKKKILAYQNFLAEELKANKEKFNQHIAVKRINVTMLEVAQQSYTTINRSIIPAQVANPSLRQILTTPPAPEPESVVPEAAVSESSAPQTSRERRPKHRERKALPASSTAVARQVREVKFENGMSYLENDAGCKIKPIHDGTHTLFGYFDRDKVEKQVKDQSELAYFENTLNTGVYVPKHQHGRSGVKQVENDFLYDAATNSYTPVTTKLRPNATGARVKGHRFLGADDKRYRLDVYDVYVSGKPAHRR